MAPVAVINAPVTTKAPTAAGHPPSYEAAPANRAAPGVDQASVTGMR